MYREEGKFWVGRVGSLNLVLSNPCFLLSKKSVWKILQGTLGDKFNISKISHVQDVKIAGDSLPGRSEGARASFWAVSRVLLSWWELHSPVHLWQPGNWKLKSCVFF